MPANLPISVQPLDAQGRALQTMRSWYTAMPGERGSCVGCHEPIREAASATPSLAARREPWAIEPWLGPERNFFMRAEIDPILARRCNGCHGNRDFAGADGKPLVRLELKTLAAHTRIVGQESDHHLLPPGEWYAESSELIQMLRKGHHGVRLTEDKVIRGGSWYDRPHRATSAFRSYRPGWMGAYDVGFRVILEE